MSDHAQTPGTVPAAVPGAPDDYAAMKASGCHAADTCTLDPECPFAPECRRIEENDR